MREWFYYVKKCKQQGIATENVGLTEWQDWMGIFFLKLEIILKNLVLELHKWLSRASLETNVKKNHVLSTAVVQE